MPRFFVVHWDEPSDPLGNVQHIAEHGLTPEEVESVLLDPEATVELSRSSGLPLVRGWTDTGRRIAVIYEDIDELEVYPVTAFEIED